MIDWTRDHCPTDFMLMWYFVVGKMFFFLSLQASATAADLLTLRKLLFEAPTSGIVRSTAGLGTESHQSSLSSTVFVSLNWESSPFFFKKIN